MSADRRGRCQRRIAVACVGGPSEPVRLERVRETAHLCRPCRDFAQAIGMDPQPAGASS